jgi:predicted site-specific integrase-resolvase
VKEWLTIPEAALLVGRDKSNVWRWVRSGRLYSRTAPDGTMEVRAADVRKVEGAVKRGRPRGTATLERNPPTRR